MKFGATLMRQAEDLARFTEDAPRVTRTYLSSEHKAAGDYLIGLMRAAGMEAGFDALGNIVGRYAAADASGSAPAPVVITGSHQDSVRNAGKYDGLYGILTAIACVGDLHARHKRLPYTLEVIGFGDEEGVRFGTTLLGSRAVAGRFDFEALKAKDAKSISLETALREFGLDPKRIPEAAKKKSDVLAYAELHIEQGPVLEAEGLAVGVVTAINGFSRLKVTLTGVAGHAGTVPMGLRRDALAAAAECVLAVERIAKGDPELVGTVGRIEALPGAINVIPGDVTFTLDVRAPQDDTRTRAIESIRSSLGNICSERKIDLQIVDLQSQGVAACAPWLMAQMERAVAAEGLKVRRLPSGAGHDGMAIQALADICMLFVRCRGGISHNPAESITEADAGAGARVFERFIRDFSPRR